jgi:hypothetical protein
MHGGVVGQLGMESGGKEATALDEDGLALVFGEDGDSLSKFFDDWTANENHFERFVGECARAEEDVAGKLAAVAVAKNGHVEKLEGILRRIFDVSGEKNRAGTGAENGAVFGGELADGLVEAFFLEELELGGGFAAGQDQAVTRLEVGDGADFDSVGAEFAKAGGVSGEVTLYGEDTDLHGCVVRLEFVDGIFD